MECKNCGNPSLAKEAKFCPKCGTKVELEVLPVESVPPFAEIVPEVSAELTENLASQETVTEPKIITQNEVATDETPFKPVAEVVTEMPKTPQVQPIIQEEPIIEVDSKTTPFKNVATDETLITETVEENKIPAKSLQEVKSPAAFATTKEPAKEVEPKVEQPASVFQPIAEVTGLPKSDAKKAFVPVFAAVEEDETDEFEDVLAKGIPAWDLEPPIILVRRKKQWS